MWKTLLDARSGPYILPKNILPKNRTHILTNIVYSVAAHIRTVEILLVFRFRKHVIMYRLRFRSPANFVIEQ